MAKFFSVDSKVYQFMSRLTDVFVLNTMWLIFSLPIVTIGISTIAAFDVSLRMAEDKEGKIAPAFIKAFKSNWKQGLIMSFVLFLCFYVLFIDFQLTALDVENSWVFLAIGIVTAYIFVFSNLYVFPLLARYENSIPRSLKNSFNISMRYFLRSFLLLIILAVEIVIIMWNTVTLFVGVLLGPAFIIYTISGPAMHIFCDLEKKPETIVDKTNEKHDEFDE